MSIYKMPDFSLIQARFMLKPPFFGNFKCLLFNSGFPYCSVRLDKKRFLK